MGKRITKVYTRTGDQGETGLGDGSRVSKDHRRVVVMGSIDELNSFLGLTIEELKTEASQYSDLEQLVDFLEPVQHRIFDLGGEVSIPTYQIITANHVEQIELALDKLNKNLAPLENFILPGGHKIVASLHLSRSICRRAERDLVALKNHDHINHEGLKYLNRLSDYLFVAARFASKSLGISEVLWQKSS